MDSFKHKITLNKGETAGLKEEIERQINAGKQMAIPLEKFTADEKNKHYSLIIGSYHQGRIEGLQSILDKVI